MKNKIFNWFNLVFLFLIFHACTDKFCNDLKFRLNNIKCTNNEECVVDMKKIFKDKWEYLYIFSSFNTSEDISEALGFNCKCQTIYDHTRLFLLVSNNNIIRRYKTECHAVNIERIIKNGFVKIDSANSELLLFRSNQNDSQTYILDFKK